MTAWLRAEWPAPPGVHALSTLRHGLGVSRAPFDSFDLGLRNGDDPAAVAENRLQLEAMSRLPSTPRWLRQVHGTGVAIEPGEDEPAADAATTSVPGVVLAVLTADCLPVVLAARDGGEVAVAHAGWRGLAAGVLEATVAAMRASPSGLLAWLGPAAGPQSYEIGREVHDALVLHATEAEEAFVPTREGHWRVDLYALARQRLAHVGVTAVHGGGLDTIGDMRFFSHRRSASDGTGRTGRMATLAWIEPLPGAGVPR